MMPKLLAKRKTINDINFEIDTRVTFGPSAASVHRQNKVNDSCE